MRTSSLPSPAEGSGYVFGRFRLDRDGTLWRQNSPIHLPPKELAALRLLLSHAGQVVSAGVLKQALWNDVHVTDDSLPRCLSSLRAHLEPDDCIQTVYKRGYRLTCTIVRSDVSGPAPLPKLAIVPFTRNSDAPEAMGRTVAEETAARLTARHPAVVSVVAWDSVIALLARGLSAQEIGAQLQADLVLAGTILSSPTHFRLRVEMIRVVDGTQIWVEDILVPRDRAAAVQSELTDRLAFRLGVPPVMALGSGDPREEQAVADARAYETFLRGHLEWQTLDRHRMEKGMQLLRQAAEMDRNFIAARLDMANAALAESLLGFMSPGDAAAQVRSALDEIPKLEVNALAGLPALGWVAFFFDRDLSAALKWFANSHQLPHSAWATRERTMLALSRRRFAEAQHILENALEADPFAPALHSRLAWTHYLAGHAEASIEEINRCVEMFPDSASTCLYGSIILAANDQVSRAEVLSQRLVRRNPHCELATSARAYTLARAGRRADAAELLERLQWLSRERYVLPSFNPAAYVELGDLQTALADLQASQDARCPWFFQIMADPRLTPLHTYPEFKRLQQVLPAMEASTAPYLLSS